MWKERELTQRDMELFTVFFISCFAVLASAGTGTCPYPVEQCPKITPVEDVEIDKYFGVWIEYYHGKNVDYQCPRFDYVLDPETSKMMLMTSAKRKDGTPFTATNEIQLGKGCTNPKGQYLRFLAGTDKFIPDELDLFLLYTDHKSHAIEYGCKIVDGKRQETFCVQAREGVTPLSLEKIKEVLKNNNIDTNIIVSSRQIDCK